MVTFTGSSGQQSLVAHQFPLSLAQERIWRQSGEVRPLIAAVYFDGPLDLAVLESCILEEISRHEGLRTSIREIEGQPFQLVLDAGVPPSPVSNGQPQRLKVVDLEQLSEQVRDQSLRGLVSEAAQPMAVHQHTHPLFHVTLIRVHKHRHCCLFAASPLILDEFSLGIVLKDLQSLYLNLMGAETVKLASPALQFADHCVWQRRALADKAFAPAIGSAVQRLAGWHPLTGLRESRQRAESFTGFARVSSGVRAKLQELARDQGTSAGHALLAAVSLQLACAERQRIVIAAHVSGRHHPQVAEIVGPLANKLLLRCPAGLDFSFRGALHDLEQEWNLAAESTDAPYDAVAKNLAPADGRWPLAFIELPDAGPQPFADGITTSVEMRPRIDDDAVLTMSVRQDGEEMNIAFASDVYDEEELERKLEANLEWTRHLAENADRNVESVYAEYAIAAKPQEAQKVDAACTATQQKLIDIWADIFGISSVGVNDDFFDLGGHSLLAVRMAARIERAFGVEVPLYSILEKPTIAELATFLEHEESEPDLNARHTLVPLQTGGNLAPLYWIPGGRAISVMALREISLLIGNDRPVYGLESRLPQAGEAFLTVPERASEYVDLIRKKQPHGPYMIAGFCMGGMVAFEMAQQLRRDGQEVGFLGMVQASMPGFPSPGLQRRRMHFERNWYMVRTFAEFAMMRAVGGLFGFSREKRQQILDRVAALLTGWVSTSSQLPEETQTVNSHVMYAYRPSAYPGRIHIFLAQDCYESAGIPPALDPRSRWQDVAGSGSDVHIVPGNHNSILTQPHARNLAEAIRSCLSR